MGSRLLTAVSWLPSFSYAPKEAALTGFWLPQTSTINWCEEDYYATIYSAEIVNTITNFMFILLAIKGIVNCYRNGHDQVFIVIFSGYACVGLGSFLFHATLKYPMQLVDELSMIYSTCLSCYASFSYRASRTYSACIAVFLFSLAVFITAYYHYTQNTLFHENAYALLTTVVVFRSVYLMETNLRPSFKARKTANSTLQKGVTLTPAQKKKLQELDQRDKAILVTMWGMVGYAVGIFLLGFSIWQLDNVYCNNLRIWRRQIGLPWGIVLEGHGWWHIMTGIGAYVYIVWDIWLRHCLNGRQDEYELYWPSLIFSVPVVVKRQRSLEDRSSKKKL